MNITKKILIISLHLIQLYYTTMLTYLYILVGGLYDINGFWGEHVMPFLPILHKGNEKQENRDTYRIIEWKISNWQDIAK